MKKIFYILSAAVIFAAACTKEMTQEQSVRPTTTIAPSEGDMALVTFKVNVPEASLYATPTRAQHQIGEQPNIENGDLFVAVFGGGDDETIGGQLQHYLKAIRTGISILLRILSLSNMRLSSCLPFTRAMGMLPTGRGFA